MATTISVSKARGALPHVIDMVEAGEEVTLTRHGVAVAVVVRVDALRARRAGEALAMADEIGAALERARGKRLRRSPGMSADDADHLLADVRASRSRR